MSDFEKSMTKEMRSVSADTEAQDAFRMGAEWAHSEAQEEIDKLKAERDEYRNIIGDLIKIFNYDHQSIYKFAKTEIDLAREVLKKYEVEE